MTSLARVTVPKTGDNDWGTYRVVKGNLSRQLQAGPQIIRFTITGASCNIDKVEFKCTVPDGIEDTILQPSAVHRIYNLAGQPVNTNYKGIVIKNGKKILVK